MEIAELPASVKPYFMEPGPDVQGDIHVVPEHPGEREHQLTLRCWCRPSRDSLSTSLVVHERRAEA